MTLGDNVVYRKKVKRGVTLMPYQKVGLVKAVVKALRSMGIPLAECIRVQDALLDNKDNRNFVHLVGLAVRKHKIEHLVQLPVRQKIREEYTTEYQEWFLKEALHIHAEFHWIPENRRRFITSVSEVLLNPTLTDGEVRAIVDKAVWECLR